MNNFSDLVIIALFAIYENKFKNNIENVHDNSKYNF